MAGSQKEGDFHMKGAGMFIVSLRGVKFQELGLT